MSNVECNGGFCTARDAQVSGQDTHNIDCDSSLGLIKAFIASEFVVDQICISTYRDVIDDLGQPRPYLCESGKLDINLVTRPFSANDCVCAGGFTKMLFNQTALARSIPVCIPNRLANIYKKIYDQV
jgi:hypothetical protein